MRTIIFLIVSLLVPLGMWVSGCSQETSRASMPKGPEMERLARAPGQSVDDAIARPPTVPALIDPEILATPDQPTFARIRAVMDREATLSARNNEPGLFVLPRQEYPEMAIVPDSFAQPAPAFTQPAPAYTQPAPVQYASAQQSNSFWSSPAPGMYDMPVASHDIPADISAMVPSAPMPASPMPMPAQPQAIAPLAPLPVLPETIPGVLTGYDIIEPARPQASVPEPAGALSPSIPDLFGDPSLGFLAPLGALEDLAGVMAANAEREVAAKLHKTAPVAEQVAAAKPLSPLPEPPAAAPAVEMAQTEEARPSPAKALDISGLLASIGPQEHASEPAPATAMAPIDASVAKDLAAATQQPAASTPEALPVMPDFGEVRPPELLKDEALATLPTAKSAPIGDEGRGAVDSALNNAWETYKSPARADRQTPCTALDPLIDYDFSAFAKKEEKASGQESASKGATPAKKIAADPIREPEAPPLTF